MTAVAALLLAGLSAPAPAFPDALGLANGVKIGEVTSTEAVLWTRLTAVESALDPVDGWPEGAAPDRYPWRVPGATGEVRFVIWPDGAQELRRATEWVVVGPASDSCHQERVAGLEPGTAYRMEAQGRAGGDVCSFAASFTTAPPRASDEEVTFVISTCQDFPRRDDRERGHRIYRSMLSLEPDFFVQTGDTLYYDKPGPFAKDAATARYKWNRLYALPNLREFHARVPSYWMHDDHDVLKNDCWPGQVYGELTWDQGLSIWREQVPMGPLPYRSFRWGRHVQVWLPEGREYRSPNRMEDGPEKSILGEEQWRWLERSLRESDATFKLYVSATPVVGPDRKRKNDNHANEGFKTEGDRLRALLSSIPGTVVINGDRHWQYHSIDPATGLREFGCGPASDSHAGGFKRSLQEEWQPFLRIKGGFLSVAVDGDRAFLRHHDVDGAVVHDAKIEARSER